MKNLNKVKSKLPIVFSLIYFAVLLYLLFLRRLGYDYGISSFEEYINWLKIKINFIPFINLYAYITAPYISLGYTVDFLKNLIGNIIIFIPMGYILPHYSIKLKLFGRFVLTVFLITLSIEIIQLFTLLGMFDINDIILNLIGAVIGFFLVKKKK